MLCADGKAGQTQLSFYNALLPPSLARSSKTEKFSTLFFFASGRDFFEKMKGKFCGF